MKVPVFGLGNLGSVSGTCLAQMGHDVIGVDANASKVTMIDHGLPPIIEEGISQLVATVRESGAFSATEVCQDAIAGTDMALVCVGTPSSLNGSLSAESVQRVCEQIAAALAARDRHFLVAVRSTVLPGTVHSSGRRQRRIHPERNPSRVLIDARLGGGVRARFRCGRGRQCEQAVSRNGPAGPVCRRSRPDR